MTDGVLRNDMIEVSEEVATALAGNQPVVALESTIIAHGLPRPQNYAAALEFVAVDRIVVTRRAGWRRDAHNAAA